MDRVLIVEVCTPPGQFAIERCEGGRDGGPWPKKDIRVLGMEGDYCRRGGCDARATHVLTYINGWNARAHTLACGEDAGGWWEGAAEAQIRAFAFRE